MPDYAAQIKDRVTMAELLNHYGFRLVYGRMPCPFHNGTNRNFSVRNRSYRCWVCGESGDVITFVQKYFGLDFQSALAKINTDLNLGLPIGEKLDREQQQEANRIAYQRRKEQERHQKHRQRLQNARDEALTEFATLDREVESITKAANLCGLEDIAGPDLYNIVLDGISDQTARALREIDGAWYRLCEANRAEQDFTKQTQS